MAYRKSFKKGKFNKRGGKKRRGFKKRGKGKSMRTYTMSRGGIRL